MTLNEIQTAVSEGRRVFWKSTAYEVIKDNLGQWLIMCHMNGSCTGLTWRDGVTMNETPADFFMLEEPKP